MSVCIFVRNAAESLAQIPHIAVAAVLGTGLALLVSGMVVLGSLAAFIA